MDLIITILPVVTKDIPISPRFTPYDFLSRCKFSTLTTRQPMVEFYLLTFPRFPLRKKHKSYFGKNRTHDFRTSRCAGYLLDHSGDDYLYQSHPTYLYIFSRRPYVVFVCNVSLFSICSSRQEPPPPPKYYLGLISILGDFSSSFSPKRHFFGRNLPTRQLVTAKSRLRLGNLSLNATAALAFLVLWVLFCRGAYISTICTLVLKSSAQAFFRKPACWREFGLLTKFLFKILIKACYVLTAVAYQRVDKSSLPTC